MSGAKLIWGGEAVAVRHDGRANPNQLLLTPETQAAIAGLREALVAAHRERFGANADGDLFVGLQLTHSGRFARPTCTIAPEPLTADVAPAPRPALPGRRAAADRRRARSADRGLRRPRRRWRADAGFPFVDIKHCHGYLGHELLGARPRPGRYGGSLENRTRFLREIVEGIRADGARPDDRRPALRVRPRAVPADANGRRRAEPSATPSGFGVRRARRGEDLDAALDDARARAPLLDELGVRWICVTARQPVLQPAHAAAGAVPAVDGYLPPEDPLRGVARQIDATARLKADFPDSRSSARPIATCRSGCRNVGAVRRPPRPDRLRRASGGSCSRIPICRPTCSQGVPLRRK